jgi:hypothetical protein
MLNNVSIKIAQAARTVALKHPNSMDCAIYRKVLTRRNEDNETLGGLQTLGGLGVLTPEDEAEYEYVEVGEARMYVTNPFQGPVDMTDRNDSMAPGTEMSEALIEPTQVPEFPIKKYDLCAAFPGGGVVVVWEIVSMPTMTGIYPYVTKYVIAPRDDLNGLAPWNEQA